MNNTLPAEMNDVLIGRVLEPGEELLWNHPASPRSEALQGTLFGLLGIVWLVVVAFVAWKFGSMATSGSGSPWIVWLTLAALAIIGLALAAYPFLAWRRAQSTLFAVTNRRMIFISQFPWYRVRSVAASEIDRVEVSPDPDLLPGTSERGNVYFQHIVESHTHRRERHTVTKVGFRDIPDYLRVADLIRDVRARE